MKKTKIIIVDDHKIVHHGIGQSLKNEKEFHVVAEADGGLAAVKLANKHNPDLMLMDISMPDINGMEATRKILSKNPAIRILALSMHTERIYVKGMLNAGASGYVVKSCSYNELLKALRTVLSGNTYLSPEITHLVVKDAINPVREQRANAFARLSAREQEVLQYIADGSTSKEMAERMNISAKTIDIHRNNLKKKLGIHTIAGLTKFAIAKGLTSTDV